MGLIVQDHLTKPKITLKGRESESIKSQHPPTFRSTLVLSFFCNKTPKRTVDRPAVETMVASGTSTMSSSSFKKAHVPPMPVNATPRRERAFAEC